MLHFYKQKNRNSFFPKVQPITEVLAVGRLFTHTPQYQLF